MRPLGWLLWLSLTLSTTAVGVVGLVMVFREPGLIAIPEFVDVIALLGVPISAATAVSFALPMASAAVLAILVLVGKREDPMALLFAYAILAMFVYISGAPRALASESTGLQTAAVAVEVLTVVALTLVFFLFPDGRFYPPWSAWLATSLILTVLIVPQIAGAARMVAAHPERVSGPLRAGSAAFTLLLIGGSLLAQSRRYREEATASQRQQMRWVLLGLAFVVLPSGATIVSTAIRSGPWVGWILLAASIASPIFPLTVAVALFRYRLYDIDLVINRTLVYGSLTVLLALVYVGGVVGLPRLLPLAEDNDLVVAGTTLAVAGLFSPLRRRVQGLVDRRFYRRRYDAQRTVEAFGSRLRNEVDLQSLSSDLLGVVRQTLQPTHASLWLREPGEGRP